MCMGALLACLFVYCLCVVTSEVDEGVGSLGTAVTDGGELPCEC